MFNADATSGPAGSNNARSRCGWLAVAVACSLALLASFAVAPSASANPCLGEEPTAPICDDEPVVTNAGPRIEIVSPSHNSSRPRDQLVHFGADAFDREDGVPRVTWVAYRCMFIHELGCTRSTGPVWTLGEGADLFLRLSFLDLGTTYGSSAWNFHDPNTGVYEIEATATDTGGRTDRDVITISVTPEVLAIADEVLPVDRCPLPTIC
jgi:hypothetical protein